MLAVSERTKGDLIDLYGVAADRIDVVPHGVDPVFSPGERPSTSSYLLFVGAVQSRKNPPAAAEAAAAMLRRGLDVTALSPDKNHGKFYEHLEAEGVEFHNVKFEDFPFGKSYDLVLNGNELGSGSVRIHRPELQERVMAVVGLTREQAYEKFGFLLDAFRFGAPPHGGIAIGLDRVVMLVVGADSLRDTIAFPKTASATSLMDGAPAEVDDESLTELHLKLDL